MVHITPVDEQLLKTAEALEGAEYGTRLYSQTALLALAAQRERYEAELAQLRKSSTVPLRHISRWIWVTVLALIGAGGLMALQIASPPEPMPARTAQPAPTTPALRREPSTRIAEPVIAVREAPRPAPEQIAQTPTRQVVPHVAQHRTSGRRRSSSAPSHAPERKIAATPKHRPTPARTAARPTVSAKVPTSEAVRLALIEDQKATKRLNERERRRELAVQKRRTARLKAARNRLGISRR